MSLMKYIIICILAFATTLNAQNPRTETLGKLKTITYPFKRGVGDSIAFVIKGKDDTLKTTSFYRSGKTSVICFKKDSLYSFNEFGNLTGKSIGYKHHLLQPDSAVFFGVHGQIYHTSSNKKTERQEQSFDDNGQLILTLVEKNTPSVFSTKMMDRNGIPISSTRSDTLFLDKNKPITINNDTAFYENGQPFSISRTKREQDKEAFNIKYFNQNGTLIREMSPTDKRLIVFKDNVDCFYGLKNQQGDTIVAARFDQIEDNFMSGFYIAYYGSKCTLFKADGSILPPPIPRLSFVHLLNRADTKEDYQKNEAQDERHRLTYLNTSTQYLSFSDGQQHGVMTQEGRIVLTPQYLPIYGSVVGDSAYFSFNEKIKDSTVRTGYVNQNGKAIFSEKYKTVHYLGYEDYFELSETIDLDMAYGEQSRQGIGLGIGNSGRVLLDTKFNRIKYLPRSALFLVTIQNIGDFSEASKKARRNGLFNARTNQWFLDTTHFQIENIVNSNEPHLFVFKNTLTQQYGIMDTLGKHIVPLSYDSIGIADAETGIFWVKKGKTYQLLHIKDGKVFLHTPQYDFLENVNFMAYYYNKTKLYCYFLAKKGEKWGLIDAADQIIKPFVNDYAAKYYTSGFFLIQNNQASFFDQKTLPNAEPDFYYLQTHNETASKLFQLTLADNTSRIFFINDTGRVMIPPQYVPLERDVVAYPYNTDYDDVTNGILVENDQKQRKIVFFETGKVIDYPFYYNIRYVSPHSPIIIVKDTPEIGFGVVSIKGQRLVPPMNYSVAIGDDKQGIFFVKRDTPILKRLQYGRDIEGIWQFINSDTLSVEDQNWLMYNSEGKLLRTEPFRFPIDFRQEIGVGMMGEDFNLYKTDGTVVTPFVKNTDGTSRNNQEGSKLTAFNNIRRDESTGSYILFKNQGLTPTMQVTKPTGEIFVESGRYDGISSFFGKYALIRAAGRIGLIDSFGKEIIAPQDLRVYKEQFFDSLLIHNNRMLEKAKKELRSYAPDSLAHIPLVFPLYTPEYHPDSMNISTQQRHILKNLMLEKSLDDIVATAKDLQIPRTLLKRSAAFMEYSNEKSQSLTPIRISVTDKTMGFALNQGYEQTIFSNFRLNKERWEDLKPNDLLNFVGEKRDAFNALLTLKVKALKDQNIDCSDPSQFINQVENRFLLTKEGIDFCFDDRSSENLLVPVSFTWAELLPFLKMRIW
jgi:hypothetical protein